MSMLARSLTQLTRRFPPLLSFTALSSAAQPVSVSKPFAHPFFPRARELSTEITPITSSSASLAIMENEYSFPTNKLKKPSTSKTPLILIACGSYSPITYMHLRLFCTLSSLSFFVLPASDHSHGQGSHGGPRLRNPWRLLFPRLRWLWKER